MRKIFTLCVSMLMGTAFAMAQNECALEFVDGSGNVIADGTTWHVYDKQPGSLFSGAMMLSGISVRNSSDSLVYCSIDYQVTEIAGGAFQICFPIVCTSYDSPTGVINSGSGMLQAGSVNDIQTEWMLQVWDNSIPGFTPEPTGRCTATLKVKQMREGNELVAEGAQITIVFYNDGTTAGIEGPVAGKDARKAVEYYTLSGRRIPSPMKGLNIVKYSDGSIRKVVVK